MLLSVLNYSPVAENLLFKVDFLTHEEYYGEVDVLSPVLNNNSNVMYRYFCLTTHKFSDAKITAGNAPAI